jgi:hypothetical protein
MIFNISTASSTFHVAKALSTKHRLCDGEWHRVKALYVQNVMMIEVDELKEEVAYASESAVALPENVALYVGGRPPSIPAHFVPKVANFVGCVRKMVINGITTNFQSVVALHNVLLDSCPRAA